MVVWEITWTTGSAFCAGLQGLQSEIQKMELKLFQSLSTMMNSASRARDTGHGLSIILLRLHSSGHGVLISFLYFQVSALLEENVKTIKCIISRDDSSRSLFC